MTMKVIGFDPSKACTGFAVFDGTTWTTGSLRCPIKRPPDGPTLDASYTGAVVDWIGRRVVTILDEHAPAVAAIEQPRVGHGLSTIQTLHLLHAIAGEICAACHGWGVPTTYVDVGTWRKAFGVKAKGTKALKQAALNICKYENIPVSSNDEAEAVGIARWLYSTRTGARFSWTSDLPLLRPGSPPR